MKKICILFLTSLTIIFFQKALAQNTAPYWSLTGNSNASSTSKLGTTNSIPLRLYTKNLERLHIDTLGRVGIGTTLPGAQLQINCATSTAPLKILTGSSVKLYLNSSGGLSVGSGSTAPANGLYVSGRVGIGTNTPNYKLHVVDSSGPAIYGISHYVGIYGISSSSYGVSGFSSTSNGVDGGGVIGVSGYSYDSSYGVAGLSSTIFSSHGSAGVYGYAYYGVKGVGTYGIQGSGTSTGVYGIGTGSFSPYGVQGFGGSSGTGVYGQGYFAIYGVAERNGTNDGYGVYGKAGLAGYAGYFVGNVYSTGSYLGSDRKLKKNIQDFSSALDIIRKLQPKQYEYRQDGNFKLMNLPLGIHYGLIAQDLEQVLPTLIKDTRFETLPDQQGLASTKTSNPSDVAKQQPSFSVDFKAINYTELIPILAKGMQEQQQQIEEQGQQIEIQQQQINDLKALLGQRANDRNAFSTTMGVLHQNTPNPANTTTRISYSLPTGTANAQLLITDAQGKMLRSLSLKSSGTVDVNTITLSSGVYSYSLLIDGNLVDTKKLVVEH
jgi:hypothetical protein